MRHVAAYLLCVLGGKAAPEASDISEVIESVGGEVNQESIEKLLNDIGEKDINELIAEGKAKISNVSIGSGASTGASTATTAAPAASSAPAAAPEKKEEEVEEEVDLGGGAMFGTEQDY